MTVLQEASDPGLPSPGGPKTWVRIIGVRKDTSEEDKARLLSASDLALGEARRYLAQYSHKSYVLDEPKDMLTFGPFEVDHEAAQIAHTCDVFEAMAYGELLEARIPPEEKKRLDDNPPHHILYILDNMDTNGCVTSGAGIPSGPNGQSTASAPPKVDPGIGVAWGEMPGRRSWYTANYANHVYVLLHEIGHNLGLQHNQTIFANIKTTADHSDLMMTPNASFYPGLNAAHHFRLGWYKEGHVVTAAQPMQTLTLQALNAPLADRGKSRGIPGLP